MIIENDSWRLRIGTVDKNQGKRKSEKGRRESIYKEKRFWQQKMREDRLGTGEGTGNRFIADQGEIGNEK